MSCLEILTRPVFREPHSSQRTFLLGLGFISSDNISTSRWRKVYERNSVKKAGVDAYQGKHNMNHRQGDSEDIIEEREFILRIQDVNPV